MAVLKSRKKHYNKQLWLLTFAKHKKKLLVKTGSIKYKSLKIKKPITHVSNKVVSTPIKYQLKTFYNYIL